MQAITNLSRACATTTFRDDIKPVNSRLLINASDADCFKSLNRRPADHAPRARLKISVESTRRPRAWRAPRSGRSGFAVPPKVCRFARRRRLTREEEKLEKKRRVASAACKSAIRERAPSEKVKRFGACCLLSARMQQSSNVGGSLMTFLMPGLVIFSDGAFSQDLGRRHHQQATVMRNTGRACVFIAKRMIIAGPSGEALLPLDAQQVEAFVSDCEEVEAGKVLARSSGFADCCSQANPRVNLMQRRHCIATLTRQFVSRRRTEART